MKILKFDQPRLDQRSLLMAGMALLLAAGLWPIRPLFALSAGLVTAYFAYQTLAAYFSDPDVLVFAREGLFYSYRGLLRRKQVFVPWKEIAAVEDLGGALGVRLFLAEKGPIDIRTDSGSSEAVFTSQRRARQTVEITPDLLGTTSQELAELLESLRTRADDWDKLEPLAAYDPTFTAFDIPPPLPLSEQATLELNEAADLARDRWARRPSSPNPVYRQIAVVTQCLFVVIVMTLVFSVLVSFLGMAFV